MLLDSWHEVWGHLRRHKLRTALTGLSVGWGVFMLVILLASGRGLAEGVKYDFRDEAINSIWVSGRQTSLAHQGNPPGRRIWLENTDIEAVQRQVSGIEHLTARFYLWRNNSVSRGSRSGQFDVRGCHPDHLYIERTQLLAGRFINARDIEHKRKVAVIGPPVRDALFAEDPYLGEHISVGGVSFQVVGLYDEEGGPNELRKIYIPISTAQLVYGGGQTVHHLMYTVGSATIDESQQMETETRALLAERHGFSAQDRNALSIQNNLARFTKVNDVLQWVTLFVWIVGIGTVLSGLIGVGNIMLISVKERTHEIGVRKALGATPWQIVRMVLAEALLVTSVSGYSGLVLATLLVEWLRVNVPPGEFWRDPRVDFRAAMIAVVVLIVAGAVAGLIPAGTGARPAR
jgi:putative ABC transport system permease protein